MSFALARQSKKDKPGDAKTPTPTKHSASNHHRINNLSKDSPGYILHLQRAIGNQAVQKLMRSSKAAGGFDFAKIGILPKLKVSQSHDVYEQEADRVAEQVMRMPISDLTAPMAAVEEQVRDRKCIACEMAKENKGDKNLDFSRRSSATSNLEMTDEMAHNIRNIHSSEGSPLDPDIKQFMELRFGHDFNQVRVHSDAHADSLNRAVDSRAFTSGRDIFFRQGEYNFNSSTGQELIAHELTHILQQGYATMQPWAGKQTTKTIQRQPVESEVTDAGPGPVTKGTGDVSIYVGKTMTSESALREIYRLGSREISQEALRMVAQGASVEDAARWANQARNDFKVQIRARGSPVVRGFAEARNIKNYGNKIGPTYEELIRKGKTPDDVIGSAGRSSTKVNRVATKLKVGGRFFIGLDIAIVTWEVISAPEGERLEAAVKGGGRIAGAVAGGIAGAEFGAKALSFLGPKGIIAGGILGGIGGAIFGGLLGGEAAEEAYDLVEELVRSPSGSIGDLQSIVIDGIEEEYIRREAMRL